MRYLIVGNGVAGTKAAETIRRRDAVAEIIVLSAEQLPFYRRPALVEYLAGRVSEAGLLARPESFYQKNRIELRLASPAAQLDAAAHRLALADGTWLDYDRLLLAVGVDRRPDWLPGGQLPGVVSLKKMADVPLLRAAARRARRAVVVGEGVLGMEMARALRELDLDVTYLLEGSVFWPRALSPEASALVEERLRSEGIELQAGQYVASFEGNDRVHNVVTADGKRIRADVVGAAAGMRPALDWAVAAGLQAPNRVAVNEYLATNLPDVYAAGDAVRMPDEGVAFGWLRAWHQGVVAGMNMSGAQVPYRGRTVTLSTRAFGLPILVMGETNPRGAFRRFSGDYPQGGVYKELVLDGQDRVIGATMVGDSSDASHVEELVRRQVPFNQVDQELMRRLFDPRYWSTAGAEVLCPVCKFLVQVGEEEMRQGRITCPICGVEFNLRMTGNRTDVAL